MKKTIGMAALALALSACGGGGGGGGGNTACNMAVQGVCFTVSSASVDNATLQPIVADVCASEGGAVSSSCSTANLAGKCTLTQTYSGITMTVVNSFYTSQFTTAEAQSSCESQGGTFSAR